MEHDAALAPDLTDPLALWRAGAISPEVTLARLLLSGISPADIAARLDCRDEALRALLGRDGLDELHAMLGGIDHERPHNVASMRAMFDAAVVRAPEASVAAFSLGDPAILERATAELLAWLNAEALLGPEFDALDLGCGIGRVAAAIAPLVRSVLAVDISPAMIAEARRRYGTQPRLQFATISGFDLISAAQCTGRPAPLPNRHGRAWPDHPRLSRSQQSHGWSAFADHDDEGYDASRSTAVGMSSLHARGFDLILAVDSFPYLVQAGVAERHAADAARLLRAGGTLAVLNLSYRGGAADQADARRWAAVHGLELHRNGDCCFTLWDGRAFTFRR